MTTTFAPLGWTGKGIYTLPEAGRLVGVHVSRIRRWLRGYRFPTKTGRGESPPLFPPDLPSVDGTLAISFLDLIELLFIKGFRDEGVSLQTIRLTAKKAGQMWDTTHPFCLQRFATDGKGIFATAGREVGEDKVLQLTTDQYGFRRILEPYLKVLDYADLTVNRWWPLGKRRLVFLDPAICFGRPVVRPHNVATEAIYEAVQADQTEPEVARWFDLPVHAVRAAVQFEKSRAA